MSTIDTITDLIHTALAELEREAEALRAALAATGEQAAAAPAPAPAEPKPKPAAPPRARKPRTATAQKEPVKVLLAGQLERMLEDEPEGLSAAAITERANAAYKQVSELLAELEAAGKVRRTGQRRGTRWHALSDEEWIARRAAELEQRSAAAAPTEPVAA